MVDLVYFSGVQVRALENGTDIRITEQGDIRIMAIENAGEGTIFGDITLTPFAGDMQVKNSGTWQVPVTWVKHEGTWKTATTGYVNDNGIWKRIL